jgi:hypothetical protein
MDAIQKRPDPTRPEYNTAVAKRGFATLIRVTFRRTRPSKVSAARVFGSFTWSVIDAALVGAKTQDGVAVDLARRSEGEYRDRDVTMPKTTQALRDARDPARRQPRKSGDFGFVAHDSFRPPQTRAPNLACLSASMRRRVVGSHHPAAPRRLASDYFSRPSIHM